MTRSEPHPQRCETCEHFTGTISMDNLGCKKSNRCISWQQWCILRDVGCASHSSAPEPNPCEENGCTDIENCDEICEHMRIYSPAYVRASRQKARAEVLDELAEPTIRASEEAEQNGDYVSQTCYEDVLKWIAALRQQEGLR